MAGSGRRQPRVPELWDVFLNGETFVCQATKIKLPEMKVKTEDFRAGGMDAAIKQDLGMEALAMEFTVSEPHPMLLERIGRTDSESIIVFKEVLRQADGGGGAPRRDLLVVTARGALNALTHSEPEAGKRHELTAQFDLTAFKLDMGGKTYHDVDPIAGKRLIGGVDQLAAAVALLGG